MDQLNQTHAVAQASAISPAIEAYTPFNRHLRLSYISDPSQSATINTIPRRLSLLRRVMVKLRSGTYRKLTDVAIRCSGQDITKDSPIVTTFDTGCDGNVNLISTRVLRDNFQLDLEFAEERSIGCDLQGRAYMSVGEVEIRWWDRRGACYKPIRAFVLESDKFDLFIGRETMVEHFGRLPVIGAFMNYHSPSNSVDDKAIQETADEKRRKNKADREKAKDQKTSPAPNNNHDHDNHRGHHPNIV